MSTHAIAHQSTVAARSRTEWQAAILARRIGFVLLASLFVAMTILPLLVLLKVSISAPQDIMTARPPFLIHNATLEHWRAVLNPATLFGPASLQNRYPVVSFMLDGVHPHDVAQTLDSFGVAVRAGHHCAQVLMERFNVASTSRASFALYNTRADVDALVGGLSKARGILAHG